MKKVSKMMSLMLALVFVFHLTSPSVFAANIQSHEVSILLEDVDETLGVGKQVAQFNDTTYYSYVDEDISFSSQITYENKIQFSYVLADSGVICESALYDVEEISSTYGLGRLDPGYESLNQTIIANILDFAVASTITIINPPASRGFADLEDAIEDAFGANYTGRYIDSEIRNYNGTNYYVRCTESQTTSYTEPDSMWFAKGTAISTIIAWLLTGGWGWVAALKNLLAGAIATTIANGITYTLNNLTVERSDVSLMHTRLVTVTGYSGTQYWAGWTRKMYFLNTELGWTHDTGYHHNIKHSDFDDVDFLLQRGYDNFINYTLTGGY